jgi:signal transduction histidine kinase/DNA-binding response OmpR family regulator
MADPILEQLKALADRLAQGPTQATAGEELKRLADALAERMDQAELDQRRAIDQLAQAGRLVEVGTMAAAVFHEMNQPLLGIKGFAELVQEHIATGSPDKIATWAQEIRKQVERVQQMQRQVSSFLRPGKTPSGQPARLSTAIEEAISLFQERFSKKKIQMGVTVAEDLPELVIDQQHLIQILVNLLGNALDALESAPQRLLRIVAQPIESGRKLRILVTDTGSGIPRSARERLFEPFFTTKDQEGSGLGLYISKRLAEQSGGSLVLAEPASLGWQKQPATVFDLRLPTALDRAEPAPAADAGTRPETTRPVSELTDLTARMQDFASRVAITRRVLVVDDEPVIQRILTEYLGSLGVKTEAAGTAEDALELLKQQEFAVVVTDKNLPGMDGIELLGRIKSEHPGMEVLVITGYASVESALDAIGHGAFDYIPKPFPSLGYVGEKVRGALERHDFEQRIHAMIGFLSETIKVVIKSQSKDEQNQTVRQLQGLLTESQRGERGGVVLVVGPDNLVSTAQKEGFQARKADDLEEVIALTRQAPPQVLVWVEEDGRPDGSTVIQRMIETNPMVGVFLVGKEGDLKRIVEAIGHGVGDYLLRPLEGRDLFAARLKRLVARQQKIVRYRNLIQALKKLNIDMGSKGMPGLA